MNGSEASIEVESRSEAETRSIGAAVASLLVEGDTVLVSGELGAGKTAFTKGVVEALGGSGVTSPTFTLCHRYETVPPVAHVDCFRIEEGDDLADLALAEVLDDGYVAIVEWGERLAASFGFDALRCRLEPIDEGCELRRVLFDASAPQWARRAPTLKERLAAVLALSSSTVRP